MEKPEHHLKTKRIKVDQSVVSALEDLFQFSSPGQLKNSLMEIFFSYLCNTNFDELKPEMKEIATDFYFLIKFLEIGERYKKRKAT